MEATYHLNDIKTKPSPSATQNACKLCAPLGAALVFKGISGAVSLLHGSQGCSTYIRRYLISHFKEPIDIACSNFGEQTAIFGGGANMKLALDNIIMQYAPDMIGVATTCLAETIGDDVPMFIHEYKKLHEGQALPPLVHVSTPSYQGTHMQGFHHAVAATVKALATDMPETRTDSKPVVNIFPGMVSPADLRDLKALVADFGMTPMMLPDYSETLDGGLWTEYQKIPPGGTAVSAIAAAGAADASIELGHALAGQADSAATFLESRFNVAAHRLGLPMGVKCTDALMAALSDISRQPIPEKYVKQRGRLLDAMVDGHKYVNGIRAAVYGEADLVAGVTAMLAEIGVKPAVCATGDGKGSLAPVIRKILDAKQFERIRIVEGVDFVDMEDIVRQGDVRILIGHSKGYSLSRKLDIPLIRIGFPIHDRVGGSRMRHLGYAGTQILFDRIANAILDQRQAGSDVGYTYM